MRTEEERKEAVRLQNKRAKERAKLDRENDPVAMARHLERSRERYARRKAEMAADPAKKEADLASRRAANKRYYRKTTSTEIGREFYREHGRRQRQRLASTPEGKAQQKKWRTQKMKNRTPEARRERERKNYWRRKFRDQARVMLSQEDRIKALRHLIPTWLPRHSRDDVLSDLTVAMLEGKCSPDMVRATIKKAVTRHNASNWKELSLDVPIPGMEGGTTFLDMLTTEDALYAQ